MLDAQREAPCLYASRMQKKSALRHQSGGREKHFTRIYRATLQKWCEYVTSETFSIEFAGSGSMNSEEWFSHGQQKLTRFSVRLITHKSDAETTTFRQAIESRDDIALRRVTEEFLNEMLGVCRVLSFLLLLSFELCFLLKTPLILSVVLCVVFVSSV